MHFGSNILHKKDLSNSINHRNYNNRLNKVYSEQHRLTLFEKKLKYSGIKNFQDLPINVSPTNSV